MGETRAERASRFCLPTYQALRTWLKARGVVGSWLTLRASRLVQYGGRGRGRARKGDPTWKRDARQTGNVVSIRGKRGEKFVKGAQVMLFCMHTHACDWRLGRRSRVGWSDAHWLKEKEWCVRVV